MSRNYRFNTNQTGMTNISQSHSGTGDNIAGSVSQTTVNGVKMSDDTFSKLCEIADDYECSVPQAMAEAVRLFEFVETFTNKHGKSSIVDKEGNNAKKIRIKL